MIKRKLTAKIKKLSLLYPVVAVTGPRQSGKTTLVREIFSKHLYLNLENLDLLAAARADPRSFLRMGSGQKIIIDEIQKFPDLFSYIQVEVDEKKIPGQFIITGSEQFELSEKISQSLAGRVANLTLLPLAISELANIPEYQKLAIDGFYPKIYDKHILPKDYYRDYLSTYVERDVRQIKNIGDLSSFQRFLQLVAGRVGQVANLSSMASDTGVSHRTIESWLSVLEASYIIIRLQPYFQNFGKRVIKSPKLYFYDIGLLCYLLGINTEEEINGHFATGHIFENMVIADRLKSNFNERSSDKLYFFRDNNGLEVDLIIDQGRSQAGVEIKSGQTYASEMMSGLVAWQKLNPHANKTGYLVFNGDLEQKIGSNLILNWKSFCLK
jgi:predicted AAA+ superfamily ATPase